MDRPPTPSTRESSNGIVILSPDSPSLSPQEEDYESALLQNSLQAGINSRSRRTTRRSLPNFSSDAMQLLPPLTSTGSEEGSPRGREVEVSPEEIRARRIEELTRVQEIERRSLDEDLEALRRLRLLREGLGVANQVEIENETARGVWRNSPIPIPRISSLPRGGRTFPYTTTTTQTTTTSSPSDSHSHSHSSSTIFSPPPPAPGPRTSLPSFETLFSRVASTQTQGGQGEERPSSLRSYFLEDTHLVGEAFNDHSPEPESEETERGYESLRELIDSRTRTRAEGEGEGDSGNLERGGGEREWTMISRPFSPGEAEGILQDLRVIGNSNNNNAQGRGNEIVGNSRTRERERRDLDRGGVRGTPMRTREETNSLSGRALRSKKKVCLIYCGGRGPTSSEEEEEEVIPVGFTATTGGGQRKGCGALLCARGLVEGVPKKVFVDRGMELEGMSSDLPPSSLGLADLEDEEEGLGERTGKRGWKSCKGCITRDLGCRRCGNHVGYRLLRPDVYCSIARSNGNTSNWNTSSSSFTSIFHLPPWARTTPTTNTNSNSSSSSSANPTSTSTSSSSSGGVTGGGVVDGLLFHFRSDRVTSIPRRVGMTPSNEITEERESVERQIPIEEPTMSEEVRKRLEANPPNRGVRLKEKSPQVGEEMTWKHIPSPQRDFLSGLISEPLDWLTPGQETWWLENSISKHSYSISGTRRSSLHPDSTGSKDLSTDTLSTATTTSTSTPDTRARSGSGANLNRSPAIRVRVPLASNSNAEVGDYDRYRTDAQAYARRVRQRLEPNGLSRVGGDAATGDGRIIRSLESAGYGSWYRADQEEEEEEDVVGEEVETKEGSLGKRKRGARQSVGR